MTGGGDATMETDEVMNLFQSFNVISNQLIEISDRTPAVVRQIIMETHHGVVLRRYIVLMILTATGSSLLFPGNNPGHTTLVEVITFPKGNYIFCCYTYPLAVPTSGENRTVQYWTAQPENNGYYCIS